jgi:two-component system, sensor histidine kinase
MKESVSSLSSADCMPIAPNPDVEQLRMTLFPFHIVFNANLEVVGLGSSLRKILPSLQAGAQFPAHFSLERPKIASPSLHSFLDPKCVYLLKHLQNGLLFRGQMSFDPKNQLLSYLGSPWLPGCTSIQSLGLTLDDFAPHDPMPELVQLMQSHRATMSELAALTEKLKEQKEALREANLQLQISLNESLAAQQRAELASRAKSGFIASVSHEVRTPLNGILGLTQLLRETSLDEPQTNYLQSIQSCGSHLRMIIDDILDFSKYEAGKLELEVNPFSLEKLLLDLVEPLQPMASANGTRIRLVLEDVASPRLGDELRVRQIFLNLVHNAIKFTSDGQITIQARPVSADSVSVAIQDTGIGIAPDKLSHVFESFIQGDSSTTRRFGGTGLGLAIVHRIVEQMQGSIQVSSELGVGSVFTVTLPLARVPEAADAEPAHAQQPQHSLQPLLDVAQCPYHPKILLVEDNPTNRFVARAFLQKMGCHITEAENGLKAVELLISERYDAVLMDCMMPVMDGLEATKQIRSHERQSAAAPVPILGLTAQALDFAKADCLAAGMNEVLTKPIRLPEFQSALKRWTLPPSPNLSSHTPQASG